VYGPSAMPSLCSRDALAVGVMASSALVGSCVSDTTWSGHSVPLRVSAPQMVPSPSPSLAVTSTRAPVSASRIRCDKPPEQIGSATEAPVHDKDGGWSWTLRWRVAASADQCVIAVSSATQVLASWDDGETFHRVLDDPAGRVTAEPTDTEPGATPASGGAAISGVTVRDDGTIYVLRENLRLGMLRPDGSSLWRTLPFRGVLLANSGRWLAMMYPGLSISDDDGASWRHLEVGVEWIHRVLVLDDGAIVVKGLRKEFVCARRSCDDVKVPAVIESHLDGRPFEKASISHRRAVEAVGKTVVRPGLALHDDEDPTRATFDSHGFPLLIPDEHRLLRYVGAGGWRLIFTGDVP
jgi:hypothetical protein